MEEARETSPFPEIIIMNTEDTTHLSDATSVALIMSGFALFLYGFMLSGDSLLQNISVLVDVVSGSTWAALFLASALIVFGVLLRVHRRVC